jgi:hypothetical protein
MSAYRKFALLAGFAALPFAASTAFAAPCAGFTDVQTLPDPTTGPFCESVEWIKNRAVTLGCTATEYCPSNFVTRLQMAAFMKRLGDALSPTVLTNTDAVGVVDLDLDENTSTPHLCKVGPIAAANYPRRAIVYAQFSGIAAGPLQLFGTTSASVNGGAYARTAPFGIGMRAHASSTHWTNVTQTASVDMAPGSTYSFAFLVERAVEDLGSNDLTEGRCNMTVQIFSRTGTSPQPDAATASALDNGR